MGMVESGNRQNASPPGIRIFHSYPGVAYALPSNEGQRSRSACIAETYFRSKDTTSSPTLRDGDIVLDACTETGIWLLELAQQITEGVKLEGFDIEARLFPTTESRPKNLKLCTQSSLLRASGQTDSRSCIST
ncbi:hypothetical protein BDQ17DRAFT_1420097 [Cyathus striatus]|nr:hypothetical protein BDQ17DRAFT_1420097 [Cyathus striatus]